MASLELNAVRLNFVVDAYDYVVLGHRNPYRVYNLCREYVMHVDCAIAVVSLVV